MPGRAWHIVYIYTYGFPYMQAAMDACNWLSTNDQKPITHIPWLCGMHLASKCLFTFHNAWMTVCIICFWVFLSYQFLRPITKIFLLGFLFVTDTRYVLKFRKDPLRGVNKVGYKKAKQHLQKEGHDIRQRLTLISDQVNWRFSWWDDIAQENRGHLTPSTGLNGREIALGCLQLCKSAYVAASCHKSSSSSS